MDLNLIIHTFILSLKCKVYVTCISPATTYGIENMAFTRKTTEQLCATQTVIESSMLGITL